MATDQATRDRVLQHFGDLIAGDVEAVETFVHEDFVQEWPQTGERVRGRGACINVLKNYPGGPPQFELARISGEGDHWVLEGKSTYPDGEVYHLVSVIELRDGRFARQTDYFGPDYPAPEWRKAWVEPIEG